MHINSIMQTPLFLSVTLQDGSDARVATGFVCTMPFPGAHPANEADSEEVLRHAYLVTARHCVLRPDGLYMELTAECPWLEGQPFKGDVASDAWRNLTTADLDAEEDAVDVAVQRLTVGLYSGAVIGHALRAVPIEDFVDDEVARELIGVGAEIVSVGLFVVYSGSEHDVEPIARYGRVAMLPRHPYRAQFPTGKSRVSVYLVESLASGGMSGAPVFVPGRPTDRGAELLGVHVGHALAGVLAEESQHSGISFVVPADKLRQLLEREDLSTEREVVEREAEEKGWRFLDNRHRNRRGVVWREEGYSDTEDYLLESSMKESWLWLAPKAERFPADGNIVDWWNECATSEFAPWSGVKCIVEGALGPCTWSTKGRQVHGWLDVQATPVRLKVFCGSEASPDSGVLALHLAFENDRPVDVDVEAIALALHERLQVAASHPLLLVDHEDRTVGPKRC